MKCNFCRKQIKETDKTIKVNLSVIHEQCYDSFIFRAIENARKKREKRKESLNNTKKENEKSKVKKTLWNNFSKFIRLRDSFERNGERVAKCISCGKIYPINGGMIHAGHFIRRSKGNFFYFNEENVHAQCQQDNIYGSQDTGAKYRVNLIKKIGLQKVKELETSKEFIRYTLEDFKRLNKEYLKKIKDLTNN